MNVIKKNECLMQVLFCDFVKAAEIFYFMIIDLIVYLCHTSNSHIITWYIEIFEGTTILSQFVL